MIAAGSWTTLVARKAVKLARVLRQASLELSRTRVGEGPNLSSAIAFLHLVRLGAIRIGVTKPTAARIARK